MNRHLGFAVQAVEPVDILLMSFNELNEIRESLSFYATLTSFSEVIHSGQQRPQFAIQPQTVAKTESGSNRIVRQSVGNGLPPEQLRKLSIFKTNQHGDTQ